MSDYPFGWPGVSLTPATQKQKADHERLHGEKARPTCRFCRLDAERARAAALLERGQLESG